jgi:hypothetical protein
MASRLKPIASKRAPLSKMTLLHPKERTTLYTEKEMSQAKKDRLKSWVTFYRLNMSYFVEHYLGVHLYTYQRVWLALMPYCTEFLGYASRASAKSWLIAVYSIARAILYPGTIIALCSSTKAQAGLIISEKCVQLRDEHPMIAAEISNITTNQNKWEADFWNGSKINVVISGETGRGHRSNVTVLEERRLIPDVIIDSIIRPFLVSRQPPYSRKPEYADLREEAQEIIISSVYFRSHPWFIEAKKFIKELANGNKDIIFLCLDYLISLKHGIKSKKQMQKEKGSIDPVSFLMEYANTPYGSSSTAFFKLGLFNRSVKRGWRPIRDETFISGKKNPYDVPKLSDEIRIVAVDVAMRAGSVNDNTIIACARLLPTKKGWATEISYLESHNGQNTTLQALRIKQIFEEFGGDVLVLDVAQAGISVYDALSSTTKDEVRGVEYEAYTVMEQDVEDSVYEELIARTLGQDARACIFPISASAQLNSAIAIKFKDRLKRRLLSFLVDDNTEENFLIKSGNKDILDQDDTGIRAYLLQANIQTSLLINECISLDMVPLAGLIKLVEQPGQRKDRYSCVSYLNHYVGLMDIQLLKDKQNSNVEEDLSNVMGFY